MSTSCFGHTLQGYVGRCSMQGSSIGHRGLQQHSTTELMSLIDHKRVALTAYLFTSSVCLTTELIFDIASIAMMPLIARLVWLLIFRPSAEVLCHRPLVSHVRSVDSKKTLLIGNEQRRSTQIVGPGSQQLILSKVHQFVSGRR